MLHVTLIIHNPKGCPLEEFSDEEKMIRNIPFDDVNNYYVILHNSEYLVVISMAFRLIISRRNLYIFQERDIR